MKEKVFRKGSLVGTLKLVMVERGANYRWVYVLALIDKHGSWLTSIHWRSNAWKKAERDLLSMGFVKHG